MCHSPASVASDAARSVPPFNRERLKVIGRIAGWLAGVVTFLGFMIPLWQACFPPLPARISLDVVFPRGIAGECEPIITTGARGDGDFLAVRYLDETNAVLLYDVWGVGGPTSRPFPLRPGERRTLEIEMPTLRHVPNVKSREKRPLRVALDGGVLLDEPAFFHRRAPREIFFASNPLGGSLVRDSFRGKLSLSDSGVLHGGPEGVFGWTERLMWMLRARLGAALIAALMSVMVGFSVARLLRWLVTWCAVARTREPSESQRGPTAFQLPPHTRAPHGWFAATAALCTLGFVTVITGGSFRLIERESFTEAYDYQAQSLLHGRLDLPEAAGSSESFIFEGKTYIYFGPTPALLRLPFAVLKVAFGRLSRAYMVTYYVALLVAVYAALIHATRIAHGRASWPRPWAVVVFVVTAGAGTTLFFVSSRAYVYHEAILCGAAFALWSGYCSLRFLRQPERGWWLGAAACGVLSVHARPSSGLFALATLGCAALAVGARNVLRLQLRETGNAHVILSAIRRPIIVAFVAAAGVLSFNGVSYLKFKSFEGAPLKYHVQYHQGRLDAIQGRNFHLSNLPFGAETYLWRPSFIIRPTFPYFYLLAPNSERYLTAKLDLSEPVAAMPYTMPAIVLLAVIGGVFAFAAWPESRAPLAIVAAGALPMSLALFSAIAVSERYTADFCPALILAGAFGLQALELLPTATWRAAVILVTILAVIGVAITLAITLQYQGEVVWGVSEDIRARYQSLRKIVDGFLGLGRE